MIEHRRPFLVALAGLAMALASPALSHSYRHGGIQIGHAWGLPSAGGETSAFFPLRNTGKTADRLLSAASPGARSVAFQTGAGAAGKSFSAIDPGGLHLRLTGLSNPLVHGDKVPLTLRFERAGTITVEVWIEPKPYAKPPKR
jgi:periplasmic copper chaperone A